MPFQAALSIQPKGSLKTGNRPTIALRSNGLPMSLCLLMRLHPKAA